jgi:hypothetical protein
MNGTHSNVPQLEVRHMPVSTQAGALGEMGLFGDRKLRLH